MRIEQALTWRPSGFFAGALVDHPPPRSRALVLFQRRLAQLELVCAVACPDRSAGLEPQVQQEAQIKRL